MIKVYIKGYQKPYAITGDSLSETEETYEISSGSTVKVVSKSEVSYYEVVDSYKPLIKHGTKLESPLPAPQATSSAPPVITGPLQETTSEALKKAIQNRKKDMIGGISRVSQVEPEEETFDDQEAMPIKVEFSGSKKGSFSIAVPKVLMNGKYTPSLGREIFKHSEIAKFLSDGSVLDGVPIIKNDVVFYTCKDSKNNTASPVEKMKGVGEILNATSGLLNQDKKVSTPQTSFSMSASPFLKVPTIETEEG